MQTILATGMVDIVDQEKLVDKVFNEVKDDMETIAQEAASDALSNADITVDAYISSSQCPERGFSFYHEPRIRTYKKVCRR